MAEQRRGAAAGVFAVKSCGNAHAWCRVCVPDMAKRLQKPKINKRSDLPPCRNCGTCNRCLGLSAPEGMKVCRKCGEAKPLDHFARRSNAGVNNARRNECNPCRIGYVMAPCERCGRSYQRYSDTAVHLCNRCRQRAEAQCEICGASFVPTWGRRYCSTECHMVAQKRQRADVRRDVRAEALRAYGGDSPACSCCGESEPIFLALDHIDGGGGKERAQTGGGGWYTWLKRNNYPPGLRLLCHNCNFGRQINGGECPHEVKRKALVTA